MLEVSNVSETRQGSYMYRYLMQPEAPFGLTPCAWPPLTHIALPDGRWSCNAVAIPSVTHRIVCSSPVRSLGCVPRRSRDGLK